MKTLQISDKNARELYKTASDEFKQVLEDTFGKDFFAEKVTDRVKTYEDALRETMRPDAKTINEIPEDLHDHFLKVYKCIILCEAMNAGKRMDIYDSNVYRYYPWFETKGSPSAFAFNGTYCVCTYAYAGSGSRLSVMSREAAKHIGENFVKEFRDMLDS